MNDAQAMLERSMRSVFVGNIPFDLTEERLKEIFSEVGPVLSFKLVYDRENGKPKGYGFCEYKDIETANSAMRNLNGFEIGGRVLKVDNAANEKTRMELQNSMAEPTVENAFEHIDPERAPEAISKAVASLPPEQMFELMKQMKQCIQNNPHEARTMLMQNPQLAYGLLQSLVVMKIVEPEIALTMLSKPNATVDLLNPEPRPVQPPPSRSEFMANQQQQMQPLNQMGSGPMGNNNDMDRPMDPRARMIGGQQSMPALGMASGDVDLRTQMPMPVPAPVMPPLPQNPPIGDQILRDPRQPPLPVAPPRDPRNMDPRGVSMNSGVAPPLPRQQPPQKQPIAQQQKMPPNMAGMQMSGMLADPDQEKAALIMQVLQLTNEQIAMLPAEQRQSILLLKEQIAKSSQR